MTAINDLERLMCEMSQDPYGVAHLNCMAAAGMTNKALVLTAILDSDKPGVHVILSPVITMDPKAQTLLKMIKDAIDKAISQAEEGGPK